jgi:hypothetical protein
MTRIPSAFPALFISDQEVQIYTGISADAE